VLTVDGGAHEARHADGEAALDVLKQAQLVWLAADREVDRVDARCDRGDGARRDEGVLAVEAAAAAVDVEAV
jgi:hypothetical protein